jgi:hypothetical protein
MAVLLISYKYNPETSKADYDGFYAVIRSYRWAKLSASNYAINADESAKAVWQKLKAYIDPDDYLVMLTFKSGPWDFTRSENSCLVIGTVLRIRRWNCRDRIRRTGLLAAGPAALFLAN